MVSKYEQNTTNMKTQIKAIIRTGLISGIVYAGIMAAFDYYDGQDFRIWTFVFNTIFFGTLMGLMKRNNLKNKTK